MYGQSIPAPKDGRCPNCGGAEYLEGPSGGMNTNIECVKCHHRWNSNPVGLPWQFIGTRENPDG